MAENRPNVDRVFPRLQRPYRLYFKVFGNLYLRTGWKIAYSQTESSRIRAVIDHHFDYHFRGRPRIIVRSWD